MVRRPRSATALASAAVSARALVLLVLVTGFVASCGGEDGTSAKTRYEEEFRATAKAFSSRAPENVAPRTIPSLILRAASDLERIEPPADIRRAHRRYVAGLRQTARDLRPVIDGYVRGDRAATRMLESHSWISPRSVRLVGSSRREFAAKGYDLGGVTKLPTP
jgi:hypothetical protein